MKNLLKMMKVGDGIIIGFLVILSFLPLAFLRNQKKDLDLAADLVDYAVISVDGDEIHRMELTDDYIRESYSYESEEGHENLIQRDGNKVYMADANCPDLLCVQQGEISEVGETIVCLPHRVVVEIVSGNSEAEENDELDLITLR